MLYHWGIESFSSEVPMQHQRTIPFLIFGFALLLALVPAPDKVMAKTILETRDSSGAIVARGVPPGSFSALPKGDHVLSIRLSYPSFSQRPHESWSHDDDPPPSLAESSRQYHTTRNRAFAAFLNLSSEEVYVSQYTPYLFYTFKNEPMSTVYDMARKLESDRQIDSMHIFPKDLYRASSVDLPSETLKTSTSPVANSGALALRDSRWDYFPKQTLLSGANVKVGLLDSGLLDPVEAALTGANVTTLYDTYTVNDEQRHPNMLANIIGGFFGLAPNVEMLYVDVNSEPNFIGIERLIEEGVDLINMSVALESNFRNGNYPINLEGYIDYLYSSTHIPMIAAAGNTLDIIDSGGYVTFPGLCANVITIGSIYHGGQPSDFSSFRIKNDVQNKPQLSAFGESRPVQGFGNVSGTSFATAAVTGAAALLIQQNGPMDMPELVSILMASANYDKIYKNADMTISLHYRDIWDKDDDGNTDEIFYSGQTELIDTTPRPGSGLINRFGAGALDITQALAYPHGNQLHGRLVLSNPNPVTLETIFLTPGQKLAFAGAWERSAFLNNNTSVFRFKYRYARGPLPNYDLWLLDENGAVVASTYFSGGNSEVLRYTAQTAGAFTLKVKPKTDYRGADSNYFDYAYTIR